MKSFDIIFVSFFAIMAITGLTIAISWQSKKKSANALKNAVLLKIQIYNEFEILELALLPIETIHGYREEILDSYTRIIRDRFVDNKSATAEMFLKTIDEVLVELSMIPNDISDLLRDFLLTACNNIEFNFWIPIIAKSQLCFSKDARLSGEDQQFINISTVCIFLNDLAQISDGFNPETFYGESLASIQAELSLEPDDVQNEVTENLLLFSYNTKDKIEE